MHLIPAMNTLSSAHRQHKKHCSKTSVAYFELKKESPWVVEELKSEVHEALSHLINHLRRKTSRNTVSAVHRS